MQRLFSYLKPPSPYSRTLAWNFQVSWHRDLVSAQQMLSKCKSLEFEEKKTPMWGGGFEPGVPVGVPAWQSSTLTTRPQRNRFCLKFQFNYLISETRALYRRFSVLRPIISIYFECASQGISTSFPGTLGTRLKVSKGGLRYGNKS